MNKWKNIPLDGHVYFITTKVTDYKAIFKEKRYIDIILENLNFYRDKYNYKLLAYVIMPEHFHLMLYIEKGWQLFKIMEELKRYTSKQILKQLKNEKKVKLLSFFKSKASGKEKHKVWEEGFRSLGIYSKRIFDIKMNYIHNNPVKRGLVKKPEDYLYSSFRNYFLEDDSIIKIDRF